MVSDLKTFACKGCKITTQKKLVFGEFFLTSGIGATIRGGTILTFFWKNPTFYIRPDGFECGLIYPTII